MKTFIKWSVRDYHKMIEKGLFDDRPVELLAGEIVEMSPETPIHYSTAKSSYKYLERLLEGVAEVRFKGPITLADSEPEPDIAIVRLPASAYKRRHPQAKDIFGIIEVAQTSLHKDLKLKSTIYARAGIQEYWVLDLSAKQMVLLRNPQKGKYSTKQTLTGGEVTPLAFEEIQVSIERLLSD